MYNPEQRHSSLSMVTPIYLNGYIETDCGSSKSPGHLGKALFHLIATVSGKKNCRMQIKDFLKVPESEQNSDLII